MNNEELLAKVKEEFKSHTEMIVSKSEESYQRHMEMLLEQHKKETQTVGEGHSTLLRKINDLDIKVTEGQKIMEKRLDRHDSRFDQIEKKLDTSIEQNDQTEVKQNRTKNRNLSCCIKKVAL